MRHVTIPGSTVAVLLSLLASGCGRSEPASTSTPPSAGSAAAPSGQSAPAESTSGRIYVSDETGGNVFVVDPDGGRVIDTNPV